MILFLLSYFILCVCGGGGGGHEEKWAGVRWVGPGGAKKSEFWAGVPEKKGRGLGGKKWMGAGGWIAGVGGPAPLPILLKKNQTAANPLSSRDSWVVNRIVTEVNHCSAEYSIALYQYMYIGPLSFESYHSSNEKLIFLHLSSLHIIKC